MKPTPKAKTERGESRTPPASPFRQKVVEELITHLEKGTAPWQHYVKPGVLKEAHHNPVSGAVYSGGNALWLSMQPYRDPRWMTYQQAAGLGAQVRKGAKGTQLEFWKTHDERILRDDNGKPVLGEDGKPQKVRFELERPIGKRFVVFNAEQIDGLEPYKSPELSFDPIERAEALLAGTGVQIHHDTHSRAFYRPSTDEIHLPAQGNFKDASFYYSTALHEVGHATGHASRLNRDLGGGFGSEKYAREELRAEIASMMIGQTLGIGHDPGNHAAYVASWIKALRNDPNELFRAAREAETIHTWVMEPDRRQELNQGKTERTMAEEKASQQQATSGDLSAQISDTATPTIAQERTYLAVSYPARHAAKAVGAKWDAQAKSWYAPQGADLTAFASWIPKEQQQTPMVKLDPQQEFAEALRARGLRIDGLPVMDGTWHRVAVEGDRKGQLSGSYRGFLDGVPAGQITNFKTGVAGEQWVAAGVVLSAAEKAQLAAQAAGASWARAAERAASQEQAARVAYGVWKNAPSWATPDNSPYLAAKGVRGYGVKVDEHGTLIVPLRDAQGRLHNVQTINPQRTADDMPAKLFIKGGQKIGLFHAIDPKKALGQHPIVIAEGYATAASLHEATRLPVVVAFDSGNLRPVAEALKAAYPDQTVVIAGDNDHQHEGTALGNVGKDKATQAAQAVDGLAVVPRLSAEDKAALRTDFNDIAQAHGLKAVQAMIAPALEAALHRSQDQQHAQQQGLAVSVAPDRGPDRGPSLGR